MTRLTFTALVLAAAALGSALVVGSCVEQATPPTLQYTSATATPRQANAAGLVGGAAVPGVLTPSRPLPKPPAGE